MVIRNIELIQNNLVNVEFLTINLHGNVEIEYEKIKDKSLEQLKQVVFEEINKSVARDKDYDLNRHLDKMIKEIKEDK